MYQNQNHTANVLYKYVYHYTLIIDKNLFPFSLHSRYYNAPLTILHTEAKKRKRKSFLDPLCIALKIDHHPTFTLTFK